MLGLSSPRYFQKLGTTRPTCCSGQLGQALLVRQLSLQGGCAPGPPHCLGGWSIATSHPTHPTSCHSIPMLAPGPAAMYFQHCGVTMRLPCFWRPPHSPSGPMMVGLEAVQPKVLLVVVLALGVGLVPSQPLLAGLGLVFLVLQPLLRGVGLVFLGLQPLLAGLGRVWGCCLWLCSLFWQVWGWCLWLCSLFWQVWGWCLWLCSLSWQLCCCWCWCWWACSLWCSWCPL